MSHDDTFFIEDIVIEFPFFQAARALYLKGLKNQNSFRYNEVLKSTAIYTADRSILFNFITSTDFDNITSKTNEAQIISELESIDETIKENLEHSEQNASDEEVEKLNHLMESHDIKSALDTQELPEFNDINDFFESSIDTIDKDEIDLIKEYESEKQSFSFDKKEEEVKEGHEMTFEEEIEKIANEFLKKIESENRTFEPDPEFKLESFDETIKENLEHSEQNASDEKVEKLNHLMESHDIKSAIDTQELPELNDINDLFKSSIDTIEKDEIDLINEYESEKQSFSFDKKEEEVKEEHTMTFDEEIEKIANEFLNKIESENRTFEPDPEFKLEADAEVDDLKPSDFDIKIENNAVTQTPEETAESSEKTDAFFNYAFDEKIKNEIENEIISQFSNLENETKPIEENTVEKSLILGNNDLENELISHFEKIENSKSMEVSNQKDDEIENEMMKHFKKIEQQYIEDETIAWQEEQNKKEQIKHEVIEYFTKLDPTIVLDDQMFELLTMDLSPELKAEIENEIIAHFIQPATNSETASFEDVSASHNFDAIESEIITHFNQLSSTPDTTDIEIPTKTVEDPIEKELREHIAKFNQDLDSIESEEPKNIIQTEEVHSENISGNPEEIIEREEIVFELLPNEIFSETLNEEKPKVEEKIEIKFDEDFSPPIKFHRNEARSFNEWLKLTTFKPINRQIEPDIPISLNEKMELIEEFIEKNPKIEPIKDIVAKSEINIQNIENEEIMTETLARVYVMQHKYSDAIRAYEILSLKFPEKSSFFADQIKQIENIRRNNLH